MLGMHWVNTLQLQVRGSFGELHIDPAMCMVFSKVVADGRLANEMEMVPLIMLPLMCVAIDVALGMLSFGKQFQ